MSRQYFYRFIIIVYEDYKSPVAIPSCVCQKEQAAPVLFHKKSKEAAPRQYCARAKSNKRGESKKKVGWRRREMEGSRVEGGARRFLP